MDDSTSIGETEISPNITDEEADQMIERAEQTVAEACAGQREEFIVAMLRANIDLLIDKVSPQVAAIIIDAAYDGSLENWANSQEEQAAPQEA